MQAQRLQLNLRRIKESSRTRLQVIEPTSLKSRWKAQTESNLGVKQALLIMYHKLVRRTSPLQLQYLLRRFCFASGVMPPTIMYLVLEMTGV